MVCVAMIFLIGCMQKYENSNMKCKEDSETDLFYAAYELSHKNNKVDLDQRLIGLLLYGYYMNKEGCDKQYPNFFKKIEKKMNF